MIETIESEKLADNIDEAWAKVKKPNKGQLRVFLQINTSGEAGTIIFRCLAYTEVNFLIRVKNITSE